MPGHATAPTPMKGYDELSIAMLILSIHRSPENPSLKFFENRGRTQVLSYIFIVLSYILIFIH